MPGDDLITPSEQSPAEGADLERKGGVVQIVAQAIHELLGQLRVQCGRRWKDNLLGVPRGAQLASRVAGIEQPQQLRPTFVVEALVGAAAGGTGKRITLAAPMTQALFCTGVGTQAMLTSFTRWNGSATWVASGNMVSNTDL